MVRPLIHIKANRRNMLNSYSAPKIADWCRLFGTYRNKIFPKIKASGRLLVLFLAIFIYSGVCLVLNLNRPIFAFEKDSVLKEKEEIEAINEKENYLEAEWKKELTEKYKNNITCCRK